SRNDRWIDGDRHQRTDCRNQSGYEKIFSGGSQGLYRQASKGDHGPPKGAFKPNQEAPTPKDGGNRNGGIAGAGVFSRDDTVDRSEGEAYGRASFIYRYYRRKKKPADAGKAGKRITRA